jgi:hypothetical protein
MFLGGACVYTTPTPSASHSKNVEIAWDRCYVNCLLFVLVSSAGSYRIATISAVTISTDAYPLSGRFAAHCYEKAE